MYLKFNKNNASIAWGIGSFFGVIALGKSTIIDGKRFLLGLPFIKDVLVF